MNKPTTEVTEPATTSGVLVYFSKTKTRHNTKNLLKYIYIYLLYTKMRERKKKNKQVI